MARRHGIAPQHRVADPVAATRAMTVLHSTEPPTPYLSMHARVDGVTRADVDRALYDDRTLVKQLAMRRTLFVFPRDLLPAAWGSASARVAGSERRGSPRTWRRPASPPTATRGSTRARARVLAHLEEHPDGLAARDLGRCPRARHARRPTRPARCGTTPRLLTHLGLTADLVRGRNGGHWRISRPVWTSMARLAGGGA